MKTGQIGFDRLWAHVHGEDGPGERQSIESALRARPRIARLAGEMKKEDRLLRSLAPLMDLSEQEVEDKVLAMYEADHAQGEDRSAAREESIRTDGIRLMTDRRVWRISFASAVGVAAAFAVVSGIFTFGLDPVRWQKPEVAPLQYRGETPAAGDMELTRFAETGFAALRESVAVEYATATAKRPFWSPAPRWRLGMRVKQLPQDMVCVQIRAWRQAEIPVREWTMYYSRNDDIAASLADKGRTVGSDLAELARNGIR